MKITPQSLNAEKDASSAVCLHQFMMLLRSYPDDLFCFFENKDSQYYYPRLKSIVKGDFHPIPCGNKSLVLKVCSQIRRKREFQKIRKAFFVDRDFDDSVKPKYPEVYETPCYSIENLYCNPAVIEELLKSSFQIGKDSPVHFAIIDLYTSLLEDFLEASLEFNAWYKLQRKISNQLKKRCEFSLGDSLFDGFVGFSLNGVEKKYSLETLQLKYPNAFSFKVSDLQMTINEMRDSGLLQVTRGKFLFSFLVKFLALLVQDGQAKGERKYLDRAVKFTIEKANAMLLLNQYAETPECLQQYLVNFA